MKILPTRFVNTLRSVKSKPIIKKLQSKLEYIFLTVDSTTVKGVYLQRTRLLGLPLLPAAVFVAYIAFQLVLYGFTLKSYQGMYNKALFRYTITDITNRIIEERSAFVYEYLTNKIENFTVYNNNSCIKNSSLVSNAIIETNKVLVAFTLLTWKPTAADIDKTSKGSGLSANNSALFRIFLDKLRYNFNGKNMQQCDQIFGYMVYVYGLVNQLTIISVPNYYDAQLSRNTFSHIYGLQHMMDANEQFAVLCHLAFEKFYFGEFRDQWSEINLLANYSAGLASLQNLKELQLGLVTKHYDTVNISMKKVEEEFSQYLKSITESEKVIGNFTHWHHVCSKYRKFNEELEYKIIDGEKKDGFYPEYNSCMTGIILYSCALIIGLPAIILIFNNSETTIKNLIQFSSMFRSQTNNLLIEKQRNESLLCEMLPKTVAKQLSLGYTVAAESFQSATIFFSDIVDFNEIVMDCTPMKIIEILNSLYNLIDGIIERFDVYKMETIGSVYMVVSGVPVRNGQQHVVEVADMSLDILKKLKNDDSINIELKIGMNTGPCVAGVVGNKMPRYCLFGDSVNTASRMQSTGAASTIHLSESTFFELKSIRGYILKKRGLVEVKGKGSMMTYWLLGKGYEN